MGVVAEWWWSCDLCPETGEEPWGSQDAAQFELDQHMVEEHATEEGDQANG